MAIIILNHTQYKEGIPIYGPTDSIRDYLKTKDEVYYLQHSLYSGNGSILTHDLNGRSKGIASYCFHRNWGFLRYLIDLIWSLKLLLPLKNITLIIATDPLNFFYGYLLKKKIIFYTVDYGHRRFENSLLNWIYYRLDRFAVKHADLLFNAAKNICAIRAEQGVPQERNIHIPNSPLLEGVTVKPQDDIELYTLVMPFSNWQQIDWKIIFDSLKVLAIEFPQIKLKLIGRVGFEIEPILQKYIEIIPISTHKEVLEHISRSAIGLECNNGQLYNNEFREPIKIREYMAFGLPTISKYGHALTQEIMCENIGLIVNNAKEFTAAVKAFLGDHYLYYKIRARVLEFSQKYNKEKILTDIFSKL